MVASADPPIAIDDSVTVAEDALPTTVDVLANDETSDNLTFVGTTDPAHGTVVVAANGLSLTYAPDVNYNGPDTFDYTVKDGSDVQATASVDVTVTPVNDPPVALDDPGIPCGNLDYFGGSFPVPEDWIGYFEDYPGWFVLFGECGLLGNDTDVDGDALDWEIVSQPAHGEAMYVEPLFFAYKPDPDWSTLPGSEPGGDWVSDSFTYRAFDGTAYSDPATMRFWLAPINDPPTFTAGPATIYAYEDAEYEAAWASDISVGPPNEAHQSITFEIVDLTGADLFSVGPVIDADGVLSFTPAPDATGLAELTVLARDDGGLDDQGLGYDEFDPPDDTSAEVSFAIEIWNVNDAPVAVDNSLSVFEDSGPIIIAVTENDIDIDGDRPTVVEVSDPGHGTAQPNADGVLYELDPDFFGTDTFTYTIEDGEGAQDTATVTVMIDPVSDNPFADDDTATMPEDSPATLIPVLVGDIDVDGDVLHVTAATNGAKGTVTITGTQLAVRYKPFRNAYGTDSFTYWIEDADGQTASATVDVTISPVNDPPNAVDDGRPTPLHVQRGSGAAYVDVIWNDNSGPDENELLAIVNVTQPAHGVVEITGAGSLTYDPAGQYFGPDQFTYTIDDGNGGTDTATVYVSVGPAITTPIASAPRVVISGGSGTTVQASVVWSATSASGISRYQLQQQADGGAWTTVALAAPTSTRAMVRLAAGHDYWFRVRAADGAGNYGAWAKGRAIHL